METSTNISPLSSGTSTPLAYEEDSLITSDTETSDSGLPPTTQQSDPQDESDAASEHSVAADDTGPKESISRLLKGKEKEWNAVAEKEGPITLLDLPVDILKEIVHQLPHTNDLTSLALCAKALHGLTIPYIYSRFDIVWPDASTHAEPRSGVDALTYGLATLVMAEEIFGEAPGQSNARTAKGGSNEKISRDSRDRSYRSLQSLPKQRRGNYYAKFTKKFSLGNGPADWVSEYLITKEGGKMLGTLVALAVARMKSLETFVWDMPTGILRDVWLALSSLADRDDPESCRLERLWIRWHDNSQTDLVSTAPPPPIPISNVPPPPPPNALHTSGTNAISAPVAVPHVIQAVHALDRVEHPTFSVIPALKSLSVMDIDELPYLDEMSILVARSRKKLRELRVGIARHAQQRDWVTAWEGDGVQQVDYNQTWNSACPQIQDKRLGGVLGILVGRVFNMRRMAMAAKHLAAQAEAAKVPQIPAKTNPTLPDPVQIISSSVQGLSLEVQGHQEDSQEPQVAADFPNLLANEPTPASSPIKSMSNHSRSSSLQALEASHSIHFGMIDNYKSDESGEATAQDNSEALEQQYGPELSDKLQLDTLELERVPISVSVLLKAFDWSMLTTLTLLHCHNHEALWKSLRRNFSPRSSPSTRTYASSSRASTSEYRLNLKKIHTNAVSPSLISFLKETLAPNSLEVLFLQEGRSYSSNVTVDAIYRGPIRRHRGSLRKLMIDSSEKGADGHATASSRWRRWMVNREILTFITSGRMDTLKELAITIDYRDWHFFLQRLPYIPHLRSLYIPYIADHAHGNNIDPKELALQIVDIVHLRPEVEICYMGISTKCFEILENRASDFRIDGSSQTAEGVHHPGYVAVDPMTSDDEGEETEEDDDDDLDGTGGGGDNDTTDSETSDDGREDSDGEESYLHDDERRGPKLRLREILFYDDKVAIFKARHGKL